MKITAKVGSAPKTTRCAARRGIIAAATVASAVGCEPLPDVIVEARSEPVTSEAGTSVEVAVRLARNPRTTVVVRGVSSDPTEGKVSKELYFDPTTWWREQVLTVTGVDDAEPDGDVTYDVSFTLSKTRHRPHDEPDEVLSFVNRDDDRVKFETFGDLPGGAVGSWVADMSASGDVVVGAAEGAAGTEAIRWTSRDGLTALGGAPSAATGVSPNGQRVVGTATESEATQPSGALWSAGATQPEFLRGGPEVIPGWPQFLFPEPMVVLDDGRIFGACIQYRAYGEKLGCRYEGPEKITLLGMSIVLAADSAGNVAGARYGSRYEPIGSLPVLNDKVLGYPPRTPCLIPHGCSAQVHDFSTGATIAVGGARLPPESDDIAGPEEPLLPVGFTYTADAGVVRLRDLAGGADKTTAYTITADGTIVGGFGTTEDGRQAVVWISGEPVRLREVLEARSVRIPAGYTLREVRAMSQTGSCSRVMAPMPPVTRKAFA